MQGNNAPMTNGSHEGSEPALQKRLKSNENSAELLQEQLSHKHESNGQQTTSEGQEPEITLEDHPHDGKVTRTQGQGEKPVLTKEGQAASTQPQKKKEQTVATTGKQKKKNTSRCKICKKGGTQSSFKGCKECGRLFHFNCIGVKKEEGQRKYICDGCKEKQKQKKAAEREKEKKKKLKEKEKEKQLKLETVVSEVVAKKRVEKPRDKVKEEYERLFQEFISKYPQLVENRKFKFPIEDQLLRTYEKIIPDPILLAKRPNGVESTVIPQEFFGDILMIWSFVSQFSENLDNIRFTQEQLFVALDYKGEESQAMLNHLFKALVKYPMLDIYYTNKIDNHKELSDQPFFTASRFLKDFGQLERVIDVIWPEFIRNLICFQQYQINFKDDELLDNALNMMKQTNFKGFYDLPSNLKIKFLTLLIACVDDSDSFHDGVIGLRQEKVHELAKERNDLQIDIKKEETDLLILENKIKEMEVALKDSTSQNLESVSRAESLKKQREWEKEKKDLMKLQNQAHKMESGLNKKRSKVQQISYDLPHYINTSQFLGFDCEKSEYWLFHTDRKKIYKREIIEGNLQGKWVFYNTKNDISDLVLSLNKRGIREKNLFESLIYVTKNEYLNYQFEDLEKKAAAQITIAQAQSSGSVQLVGNCIQLSLGAGKNGLTLVDNKEGVSNDKMEVENEVKVNQKNKEIEESTEESKEHALQFVLNYEQTVLKPQQPQSSSTRSRRSAAQKSQNEKTKEQEDAFLEKAKSTLQDVKAMILQTENMYTSYLANRNSRWAPKQVRDALKAKLNDLVDPREIQYILDELSESFSAVDRMFIRDSTNNGEGQAQMDEEEQNQHNENNEENGSVYSDEESYQGVKGKNGKNEKGSQVEETPEQILESFENNTNMRSKKFPMRIWGAYVDKVKKSWQNLLVENVMGSYLATYIFCFLIQKFIQRRREQHQLAQDSALAAQKEEQQSTKTNSLLGKRKAGQYIDLDSYKFESSEQFVRRSDRQKTKRPDMTEIDYDLEEDEDYGQDGEQEDDALPIKKKNGKEKRNTRKSELNKEQEEEEYECEQDVENDDEEEGGNDGEEEEEEGFNIRKKGENNGNGYQKRTREERSLKRNGLDITQQKQDDKTGQEDNKKTQGRSKKTGSQNNESDEDELDYQKDEKNEDQEDKSEDNILQETNSSDKQSESTKTHNLQHLNGKNKVNKLLESMEEEKQDQEEKQSNNNHANGENIQKDGWDEQCKKCGLHGELIMCDSCPSVFHLKCTALKIIPSGEWKCQECTLKQEQKIKDSSSQSNNE